MKGNLKMKGILIATALLLVMAFAGSASATVSNLQWTDGDDYTVFCNETVTFNWVDDTNTTSYFALANASNTSHIIKKGSVSGSYNPSTDNYEFEYNLTDYSKIYGTPNATETLVFAVNYSSFSSDTNEGQVQKQFQMNNYSVSLSSTNLLAGTVENNTFITINTTGASLTSDRTDAFSLNSISTNGSATFYDLGTNDGNVTVNATIGDSAGQYWINVSTGGAERVKYFNVTDFDIQTTKVRASTSLANFSYFNLTGGSAQVDNPVLINITIDDSLRPNDEFNSSLAVDGNNQKINITLLSGQNNWTQNAFKEAYGNYTNPIELNASSDVGAGQLIIDTNVTGNKQWTVDYEVVSATTNITGEISPSWARVGDSINITSWYVNPGTPIWANITYYNGSATVYVENISISTDSTYGTNTTTWDTNATWQQWFAHNRTFVNNPEAFTINVTDAVGNYTTQQVELFDYMAASTNVTDWIAINKTFNMTVNSSMRNATAINFNITSTNTSGKTIIINDTLSETISNYNATTYNSSVELSYNTSTNYTELASTAANGYWGTNGVGTKTLTILANDTAWSDTTTVTLKDEIIIDSCPSAAVPGQTIKIKGKVLRQAGTVINATITGINYDTTIGTTTNNYNSTTGYSNFTLNWSATTNDGDDLQEGTYQLYVNDTFVRTSTRTVDLQAGELNYTVSPDPAGIDETVWFNGTTNLAEDTVLTANVTKNGQIINNATNTSTVESDGTFSISWLPSVNTTEIREVGFTQPETTYQVNVSNATNEVYLTKTFNLSDILAVDDVTIATGDMYNVTGTTTRANGTTIIVNVTGFNIDHGATTTAWDGQFNQSFYATIDNTPTGTKLDVGDYTIEVNDSITTATGTLAVQTPYVTITSPTAGQEIGVGTNVSVTGDTNRGDGSDVDVTITGPNYASGTQTVQVQDKSFTYYWNTTGLEDQLGTYYITVETTVDSTTYTDQISVELVGPANVTLESFTAPSSVAVDESFKLNATVNNTGGAAGDILLDFKKENATTGAMEVFDTKTVNVDAGATKYVESNSTSYATARDYNVTVNDLATKTVTVKEEVITYANDLDGDGLYEDVSNDESFNFGDVVALFENFDSTQFQDDKQYFDFTGDGNLNFGDVVELFNML